MKLASRIAPLLAALAFLLAAQPAQAEPENPIVTGNLEVQIVGGGKVTGTGIDCGSGGTDCAQRETWRDNELPPKNRLTAVPNTGWGFLSWSGCTVVAGATPRCDASYGTEEPTMITARFIDVQAPSVFLQSPADGITAGNSLFVSAETTDNDRVAKVEYLVDGAVVHTTTNVPFDSALAPYSTTLDISGLAEGNHRIQVRSFDPTGNNGITAARNFTVDHTSPDIQLSSPLTATNAARPQFSFTSASSDLGPTSCVIQKKGDDDNYSTCSPGEWFAGDAPEEGEWQFAVWATDRVGNITQVVHDFVVDRTAPAAAFTAGPADGSVVEVGNVRYEWSATDSLPVTQECTWDNGEASACDGSAARGLTAGPHTFKVTITDQAGNRTELARSFSVKKDGDTPPPDPDPDETDRTPPVVKLTAPKQNLRSVRKALKLNVRCNEACSGKVIVKGKRGVKFSGRVNLAKPGVAKLKLRPTAKVRKRLVVGGTRSRKRRALALTASTTLRDSAGNVGKASLKFKVRS